MISKLAKGIAHFFVINNIAEKSKEVIYAYGMELLISDILNTLIVLLIALISHTLPAVIVFITVFMGLRRFVGGYHANSHLSCMTTLVAVMLTFCFGICNATERIAMIVSIGFVVISIPVIFRFAPVAHPNKPMSEEKGKKLKKYSRILVITLSLFSLLLMMFRQNKISLYVSSGIFLSALVAVMGKFLNRGEDS